MVIPELWKERITRAVMRTVRKAKRLITRNPEPPEDPYSYVTAPKKPLMPVLSAAAVAELPKE